MSQNRTQTTNQPHFLCPLQYQRGSILLNKKISFSHKGEMHHNKHLKSNINNTPNNNIKCIWTKSKSIFTHLANFVDSPNIISCKLVSRDRNFQKLHTHFDYMRPGIVMHLDKPRAHPTSGRSYKGSWQFFWILNRITVSVSYSTRFKKQYMTWFSISGDLTLWF